jgi:cellulose synthase (UDP-forming)
VPFAWLLIAADAFGVLTTLLFLTITRRIDVPVPRPAPARMPSVDVLIPTINEPLEVVGPTIRGALAMSARRRVIVLDDGDRAELRALCEDLGAVWHARRSARHAKAGNLNAGLALSDAELLVTLDADHVPCPDLIMRLVGYFDDPHVGFVQTPQTYHNTETFLFRPRDGDPAGWSEQGMFYDVIQPAKNRANAAFYVGTSAMLRRSALDSVGGFATGTATEDIHTSLRLHAAGWRSVFHPEALALGLEAASLREFHRQRRRWAAGSLGLLLRSPDSPLRARGLTLAQRANYLSATLAHAQGVQRAVYLLVPALCVVTARSPAHIDPLVLLAAYVPFLALSLGLTWAFSRGTYHPLYTEAYGAAAMLTQIAALRGVLQVQRKFDVSRKRVARSEHTWVRTGLWVLVAGCVLVVAAGALRLILGGSGDPDLIALVTASALAASLNGALLLAFLLHLRRWEQSAPDPVRPAPAHLVAVAEAGSGA